MSLSRYENESVIVQLNEPQYGQLFTSRDLSILPNEQFIPDDVDFVSENITQVHIYSFYGDYIAGDHNASYLIRDPGTNSLLIDLAETFREANIIRGSYTIAINAFKQVWGSPDKPVVFVEEISPDRTEIKLNIPSGVMQTGDYNNFKTFISEVQSQNVFNNLIIDFGFNRVSKIVLIKFDKNDPSVIYIKLYKELNDEIDEKNTGWFGFETIDPYVDTVILSTPVVPGQTRTLKCANYDIDIDRWTSNATIFKTWNDLLDTDATTSQRIIDASISGSVSARLNIDYTDFSNFIFYSSAEERVKNFKYKISLIDGYNDSIDVLQASTASNTIFISSSISTNQTRINTLVSTFDSFERWMYYEGTGSLFTHGISGSITPYPKYLSGGNYVLHHNTSSIVTSWYNDLIVTASDYDKQNVNRLWWSIPEHVIMDEGNDDYSMFIDMIGQHFDNLYAYVKALTKIHERDEHPERGVSNDLLYHIAESFGWKLQNTRQLSDLWFYKAGLNQQGTYDSTGSMFSLSHENQTQQIWRRIVNNLPYLLKTKGTSRSIKALMSIYGIPQTLISIKEYGGPRVDGATTLHTENHFGYKLKLESGSYVELGMDTRSDFAADGWKNNSRCDNWAPDNMFENPTFENSVGAWLTYSEGEATGSDPLPSFIHSGSSGLMTSWQGSNLADDNFTVYQEFDTIPGQTYKFEVTGSTVDSVGNVRVQLVTFGDGHNSSIATYFNYDKIDDTSPPTSFTIGDTVTARGRRTKFGISQKRYTNNTVTAVRLDNVKLYPTETVDDLSPQVFEFRFSSLNSGSTARQLLYMNNKSGSAGSKTSAYYVTLNSSNYYGSSSISGSGIYGKLDFLRITSNYGSYTFASQSTEWIPFFDGDMWTVKLEYNQEVGSNIGEIFIGKASDCGYGVTIIPFQSGSSIFTNIHNRVQLGNVDSEEYTWLATASGSAGEVIPFEPLDGHIQAVKTYYGTISPELFNDHLLNPLSYEISSETGSYYSLYQYFPLGLDVQRWNHESNYLVRSSSHPDRSITSSPMTFVNFTGSQSDYYTPYTEVVYKKAPTLGGQSIYNDKIRQESSTLQLQLSPSARSTYSQYDLSPLDTNRLAIVFSLTDQVNRDIINHMGNVVLDNWVGDPEDEFNCKYNDLKILADEYWQKYTQRPDINTFIRIFSVYDYTFFEQIKQLVPGRADLIAGILIEPTVLERSKVCLTKRPTVENPQYDKTIVITEKPPSGEYLTYEGSASAETDVGIDYCYETGSIDYDPDTTIEYCYETGSIEDPAEFTIMSCHHIDTIHQKTGICGVVDVIRFRYSGSATVTQSVVEHPKIDTRYVKKEFYYDPYTGFENKVSDGKFEDSTSGWGGVGIAFEQRKLSTRYTSSYIADLNKEVYKKYVAFTAAGEISQSFTTVVGKEYSLFIRGAVRWDETIDPPFHVSMSNKVFDVTIDKLTIYNEIGNDIYIGVTPGDATAASQSNAYYIRKAEFRFTGSGQDDIKIISNTTDQEGIIFEVSVQPYFTRYQREWLRLQNREVGKHEFYVEVSASYQNDENGSENQNRYIGCKMTSADFNVDSPDTIDGGPVVTIIESNPNNLFIDDDCDDGNLLVE